MFSRVNQTCRALALEENWKYLVLSWPPPTNGGRRYWGLQECGHYVRNVHVGDNSERSSELFTLFQFLYVRSISIYCKIGATGGFSMDNFLGPSLRILEIDLGSWFDAANQPRLLTRVAEFCPNLDTFDVTIGDCPWSEDIYLVLTRCEKLSSVGIEDYGWLRLTAREKRSRYGPTLSAAFLFVLSGLPHLRRLNLGAMYLESDVMEVLMQSAVNDSVLFPHVKEVSLNGNGDALIAFLSLLYSPTSISLRVHIPLELESKHFASFLRFHDTLTTLSIYCQQYIDFSMLLTLKPLKRLENLSFHTSDGHPFIRETRAFAIDEIKFCRAFPGLRVLHLNKYLDLTDRGVEALGRSSRRLSDLRVTGHFDFFRLLTSVTDVVLFPSLVQGYFEYSDPDQVRER